MAFTSNSEGAIRLSILLLPPAAGAAGLLLGGIAWGIGAALACAALEGAAGGLLGAWGNW